MKFSFFNKKGRKLLSLCNKYTKKEEAYILPKKEKFISIFDYRSNRSVVEDLINNKVLGPIF